MDGAAAYRALKTRDTRFDGRLFVGVMTTGIYCRPVCPANTPKPQNCRFYPSAAAAQEAGFRPCLRCRPEHAPAWAGTSKTVSRALSLIADGAFDDGVEALAERLGVGGRQLRRLFKQHLGATPASVAQTRRVLFAKQLITETALPMSEVAFAAGFGSVRRFNETFKRLFDRPPNSLRKKTGDATGVTLRLPYRPPYAWDAMLAWWDARTIEGVDRVEGGVYHRTLREGSVTLGHDAARQCLVATIEVPNVRDLSALVARLRDVFDLKTDVCAIEAHLARDPMLRPLVAKRPGLRVPGGWDPFEVAVRAVLGQQVSVAAARKLLGTFVRLCGTRSFPSAAESCMADLSQMPMPRARKRTLIALTTADLSQAPTLDETLSKLKRIDGVGDWTAHYIALRAFREPDAFPASDVGLLRAAANNGARPSKAELITRAERWRPWRAYAAQHLWSHV